MKYIHQDHYCDGNGRVIQGGTVTVYLAGTSTLANIYSSADSTTPISGSTVTTAIDGLYTFYVSAFDYDYDQEFKLVFSKTNYSTTTYDKVLIKTPVIQTYVISTNTTVSAKIKDIPYGVLISPANGVTITFSGSFEVEGHKIFDTSAAGTVLITGANKIKMSWWGTNSVAMNKCFTSVANRDGIRVTFDEAAYTVESTVNVRPGERRFYVDAQMAAFTGSLDDDWFDIQYGDAGVTNNRFLLWDGGYFINGTMGTSCLFKMLKTRQSKIWNVHGDGFYYGAWVDYGETVSIEYNMFLGCYYPVYVAPNADFRTQNLTVRKNTFTSGAGYVGGAAVRVVGRFRSLDIMDNTFDSEFSEATMNIDDAPIGSTGNPDSTVTINSNHIEGFSDSAQARTVLKINNVAGIGVGCLEYCGNMMSTTAADAPYTATYLDLEKVLYANIDTNPFYASGAGNTLVGVNLDADCTNIHIGPGNDWTTTSGWNRTTTVVHACPRNEITFGHSMLPQQNIVTGYTGVENFSTDGPSAMSMVTLIGASNYPLFYARQYILKVRVRDSGSAGAPCSLVIKDDDATDNAFAININLEGVGNDVWKEVTQPVTCSATGGLRMTRTATGVDTMNIELVVLGYSM